MKSKRDFCFCCASGVLFVEGAGCLVPLEVFFSPISSSTRSSQENNLRPTDASGECVGPLVVAKVNEITDAESYASSALLLFKELGNNPGGFPKRLHRVHGSHVVFCADMEVS